MNLPFLFAKRYLFSKKTVNAINIISGISVIGVLVSSAALIILLSSFNGMENIIISMYSQFAPELKIEPRTGKLFDANIPSIQKLKKDANVLNYTEILQEKILLQYDNKQYIGTIKGIEANSIDHKAKDSLLISGEYTLMKDNVSYAVIGAGVQANLGISVQNALNQIDVYSPRKGVKNSANPADEFNIRSIQPAGVLKYQQDFDNLIITPITFAREALGEYNRVSAIEFYVKDKSQIQKLKNDLQTQLGENFVVKDREEQNPTLYKNVRVERWAVYFILTLISIIALFNIVGSLTMLVLDKKEDMNILKNLGANSSLVQKIFFYEGLMISILGCSTGLIIGYLFCFLQINYGLIKVEEGANMLIDSYPVALRFSDFVIVFFTISIISGLISYFSAKISVAELNKLKLTD
ncbi:FtsX-like permease family protein [Sphingobacterium sp. SRCM116780]|uniref:ABC transporter permease n=1 Tax=Sphingobacterium sp. SRCM116780 TaxID=2907623 RepID=UPI001F1F93A8|nr:FtsX-like permease family protein [Sphingobacterium sp. SRCM116780]UIR55823.1 FtsX-like permease family protein [Sphingobacterium sp. SRCM116780]